MTAEERRLRVLLARAQRYVRHHPGCRAGRDWPRSPRCNCGAREIYERLQLERIALREPRAA